MTNNNSYFRSVWDQTVKDHKKSIAAWKQQPLDYRIARMVSTTAMGTALLSAVLVGFVGSLEEKSIRGYAQPQKPAVIQNIAQAKKYLTEITCKIGNLESEMAMPYASETLKPLILEKNQTRKDEQAKLLRETEVVKNDILAMEKDPRIFHYKNDLEEHLNYLKQGKATVRSVGKIADRTLAASVLLLILAASYADIRKKK